MQVDAAGDLLLGPTAPRRKEDVDHFAHAVARQPGGNRIGGACGGLGVPTMDGCLQGHPARPEGCGVGGAARPIPCRRIGRRLAQDEQQRGVRLCEEVEDRVARGHGRVVRHSLRAARLLRDVRVDPRDVRDQRLDIPAGTVRHLSFQVAARCGEQGIAVLPKGIEVRQHDRQSCSPSRSGSCLPVRAGQPSHITVTSPSRHRRTLPCTGHCSLIAVTAAIQRCRVPKTPCGAAAAQAASRSSSNAWIGSPRTLRAMSDFGSRSARSDGRPERGQVGRQGERDGGAIGNLEPAPPPTDLVARAFDDDRSGSRHGSPGLGHGGFVVLAQDVHRADQTGRRPANSKPPRRNSSRGGSAAPLAALTRSGSISRPTTRTSGATRRNRVASSTVVIGEEPKPRSTTSGASSCATRRMCARVPVIQRSTRRSRLGAVVPRVGRPSARARPAARRGGRAGMERSMPGVGDHEGRDRGHRPGRGRGMVPPSPGPAPPGRIASGLFPACHLACADEPDEPRLRDVGAPGTGGCRVASTVTRLGRVSRPRRVAMLSVHTSPLDQPGTGDAGGMNVYIVELARQLAARGIEVEIFTRATRSELPPVVELAPGVLVRHVTAGPYEGLGKNDLPAQLCAFTAGLMRVEAAHEPGWYDLVHSHYWLSGQVGWLAAERWAVPLVPPRTRWPRSRTPRSPRATPASRRARVIGEEQVVAAADRLIATPGDEAAQLVQLYDADPGRVDVVAPGVDLEVFRARRSLGRPDPPRGRRRRRCAAVRRAHPAAEGAGRAAAGRGRAARARPVAARPARRRRRRRSERQRAGPAATPWRSWPHSSGIADVVRFEPPAPPGAARRLVPRGRRAVVVPATTSRSAWSRSRRRPAARRWSPPRSAACGPRCATVSPACSFAGTTRPTTPTSSRRCCADPRRGGPRWRRCGDARGRLRLVGDRCRRAGELPGCAGRARACRARRRSGRTRGRSECARCARR